MGIQREATGVSIHVVIGGTEFGWGWVRFRAQAHKRLRALRGQGIAIEVDPAGLGRLAEVRLPRGRTALVNASVTPRVPSGNIHIPTIMVAEKMADVISRSES